MEDSGVPRLETKVKRTKLRARRAHIPRPSGPNVLAILIPKTMEDRITTILNMKVDKALLKKAIIVLLLNCLLRTLSHWKEP